MGSDKKDVKHILKHFRRSLVQCYILIQSRFTLSWVLVFKGKPLQIFSTQLCLFHHVKFIDFKCL